MKSTKQITPTGKMSNLVGMWAFIWEGDVLRATVFIYGKADDDHYIVQGIDALGGCPNACKVVHFEKMLDWTFYDTRETVEYAYDDYSRHERNRFRIPTIDKYPDTKAPEPQKKFDLKDYEHLRVTKEKVYKNEE